MISKRAWFLGLRRRALSLPVLIAAIALVLYALAGFVLAPYLLTREIPRFAETRLQAKAAVAEARVNPFLLTVELRGFRLTERDQRPVLAFDRLLIDLEASSLFRWTWTFSEIAVEGLGIDLDIDPGGELNLARLVSRLAPSAPAAPAKSAALPRMLLHHLAVVRGRIAITDRSDPTPAQAQLERVSFDLKDLSTLPGHRGDHTVSARLPAGGSLAWRGNLTLQPIVADGKVTLKDLKVATLWRFLQDELRVEEPAGSFDMEFRYAARPGRGAIEVTAADIGVRAAGLGVKLRGAEAPILTLAEIALSGGAFDFAQRKLSFAQLALRRGEVSATRDEAGAFDWTALVVPAPAATVPPGASEEKAEPRLWRVALDAVRVEEVSLRVRDATRVKPLGIEVERIDAGFSVSVEHGAQMKTAIDALAVQLSGLRLAQQNAGAALVTLDSVTLDGGKLDTAGRTASVESINLRGGETAAVRSADGIFNLAQAFVPTRDQPPTDAPFEMAIERIELAGHKISATEQGFEPALRYDLEDLALKLGGFATDGGKPLRFDFAARVAQGGNVRAAGTLNLSRSRAEGKIAISRVALSLLEPLFASQVTLKLASGSASADGRFHWEANRKDGQRLGFAGSATVDDLLLNDAAGSQFAASRQIAASGVALELSERRLAVDEVRLVAPEGKLVINKDRSTNLAAIMRAPVQGPPAATVPSAAAPGQKFVAMVDRVRIENGQLDFADLSLVLPFSTRIRELSGTIVELTSDPGTRAGVKLEGQVAEDGLARIDGTINLFAPKTHTDLVVAFRNVTMPPLSPYSATFAGRRIASGRLALDLHYKLDKGTMQGENKVVLQQFTLGERVKSPSAMDLPLDFAVALLTDSEGKIDLVVPVRGNVDSPEFSYSQLVWQAVGNFLTRIVTAPFRALASLFGGEEKNLDEIAFDAGSARLLPPEREKLARLTETLRKRPQLRLLVQGRYHPARDGGALRDAAARRVLAERLGSKVAPGEDAGPVAYGSARTQTTLEAMLSERGGADARASFIAAYEKETGRQAQPINAALALIGRGSPDREFYEAIFRRIVELQPLPPNTLEQLGRERGAVVTKQVVAASGLGPARVGQLEPEAVSGTQVTTKLSLDVAKATQ